MGIVVVTMLLVIQSVFNVAHQWENQNMSKVHIVIPIYNHWEMTHSQLFQLYKKEQENIDSILVVDDASPEDMSGLNWWLGNGMLPVVSIENPKNVGFLRSSNLGMKIAVEDAESSDDDIIVLLSSDVEIHGKFIQQIKDLLEENSERLVGGRILLHDTGWNVFDGEIFPYLEGWLLATTVNNWRELGYFDDRFFPFDYEDVDLSTTAKYMGYELVPLNNPNLVHLGGRSIGFSEKRLEQTNINKEKFRSKWIK